MNNSIKYFDGLTLLEELEKKVNMEGLKGVIQLVKDKLDIGSLIKMDSKSSLVYKIERIKLSKIDPDELIENIGDKEADSVIRSMNLPYVNIPFQIDIYGSLEILE
jgi:hypothetical protein